MKPRTKAGTKTRTIFAAALLGLAALAGGLASAPALARVHFGVNIGIPLGWPGYYYPPPVYYPYYPPATVVVPAAPQTYIERAQAPQARSESWWYYCADAKAYYPYVKQCPGGWQRVSPTPPSAR